MLQGLETSSSVIARGKIIERLYFPGISNDHQQLETALIKLYSVVLEYLAKAKKCYDKSTAKRFLHSIVSQSDLANVLEKIREQDANVESLRRLLEAERQNSIGTVITTLDGKLDGLNQSVGSLQINQAELKRVLDGSYARSVAKIEALHDNLEDLHRRELLRWLSTIPFHQHHETLRRGLISDSGQWLLSSQEYLNWKTSSSAEIFLLHGIPGCGKTRLVTRVVDELQAERSATDNAAPLAYFYCSRDTAEPKRADPCSILRTLVKQLSYVTVGGSLLEPTLVKSEQCVEQAALHGLSPTTLNAEECFLLIRELTLLTPLTIVIDAVDECDPIERHILFKTIENVVSQSRNVVKIFLSGRQEDDVIARFGNNINLEVTDRRNSGDLCKFVESRVHETIQQGRLIRDLDDPRFEQRVIDALKKGAHGMYVTK